MQSSIKNSMASKRYSLTHSDNYSDESFGKGNDNAVENNKNDK